MMSLNLVEKTNNLPERWEEINNLILQF